MGPSGAGARPRTPRSSARSSAGPDLGHPSSAPEVGSPNLHEFHMQYKFKENEFEAEQPNKQAESTHRGGIVPLLGGGTTDGVPSIIMSGYFGARNSRERPHRGMYARAPPPTSILYNALQPHTRGEHTHGKYSKKPAPGALREVRSWGAHLHAGSRRHVRQKEGV